MKVALDVGPLKPRPAGVGIYVRSLANALAGLADIDLVQFGRRPDAEGLPKTPTIARSPRLPYSLWVELLAPLALRGVSSDIVHHTDGLVPVVSRRPTVVTVLDLSLVRHWRSHRAVRYPRIPLVLAAPRLATRVVVPSRATADEVMRLTGTAARKIDVVPLAPAPATTEAATEDAATVLARHSLAAGGYILALGTIEPRKNHLRVIEAFERGIVGRDLPDDLLLVIAGQPGWGARRVFDAVAASPASSRIRLVGYVPDADLPVLLSRAAAVAYASTYEGFGLPVLEALSQGAAVVTSNLSSMPEVAGDAAILVDPFDVESIARGLSAAVSGAAQMRVGAVAQAARFTWMRTADGTRQSYEAGLRG
jgi:glycosyltransferase involved in cell wall biosynthesis